MAQLLLIEPDHRLSDIYAQALTAAGHQVSTAQSAQAGITAADATRPDLVILELQLVEHSGIEFLYEFRSYVDWQTIPVIIQSHVPAGEFSGSRQLLYDELGVRTYLYKPHTTLRRLLSEVQALVPVPA